MKRTLMLITLFLQACTYTPAEIRDAGALREFKSVQPPHAAARCIVRNAEARDGGFTGIERDNGKSHEVTVRAWSSALAVADVMAKAQGSTITLRAFPGAPEEFVQALVAGC